MLSKITKSNEKRIEHRISAAFIVKCTYLPEKKNILLQNKKNTFYNVCKNISSVGIKMLCEDRMPLGKNVDVNINLLTETIQAKGQVVWNKKRVAKGKYLIGLKFLDLNDNNQRKLGDFIDTIYLHKIRNIK